MKTQHHDLVNERHEQGYCKNEMAATVTSEGTGEFVQASHSSQNLSAPEDPISLANLQVTIVLSRWNWGNIMDLKGPEWGHRQQARRRRPNVWKEPQGLAAVQGPMTQIGLDHAMFVSCWVTRT